MDPDEVLNQIRSTIERLGATDDARERYRLTDDLIEFIQGLDEWITKGGFLPADWKDKA